MSVRCFVAVELDDAVRRRLADIQQRLKETGAAVRWSKPENLHLTLKFLGEIDDENVGAACTIVERVAAESDAFEVEFAGLGAFPSRRRPRVVFAHAEDPRGSLARLAREFDRAMTRVGAPRERRPFRSHVTLGRVKSPRGLDALLAALAELEAESAGRQRVREIALLRSELRPDGPIYSRLGVGALRDEVSR